MNEDPRPPDASADPGSAPHHLAPGTVIADRYRVDAMLGEGGMGVVYRAEHVHMRKRVALKVLLPEFSRAAEVVARFEREAIAAGHIAHPHVAAATDFGRLDDGSFFLVLEYVEGRTLREVLDGGALAPARALHVARGILGALGAAHAKGIVHRDLKPENVMLVARDRDADFVKVLDFGVAKVDVAEATARPSNGTALTRVGMIIGTPDYMAPEQALGQPVDARADLYALGVMLFEMLAGQRPFEGGAATVLRLHVLQPAPPLPDAVLAAIDPRVAAVVRRALEKEPSARFATAAEMLAAIDECARASSLAELPPAPSEGSLGGLATPSAARAATAAIDLASLAHAAKGVRSAQDLAQLFARARASSGVRRLAVIGAASLVLGMVLVFALVRAPSHGGDAQASEASTYVPIPPPPPRTTAAQVAPKPSASAAAPAPSASVASTSDDAEPSAAPPPASSSGRAGKTGGRRTGPGGIYIPPPSRWFK